MICPECEVETKHVSGPTEKEVLEAGQQDDPIFEECHKCGRDYEIRFYPEFKVYELPMGAIQ